MYFLMTRVDNLHCNVSKQNYPEITIETSAYMKGAGAGDTNVLLAYKKDPMKVAMETPLPYNVLAPQFPQLSNNH